jgi:hypothetical protein
MSAACEADPVERIARLPLGMMSRVLERALHQRPAPIYPAEHRSGELEPGAPLRLQPAEAR